MKRCVAAGCLCLAAAGIASAGSVGDVSGPDGRIRVIVSDDGGRASYSIALDGSEVLRPSPLGLSFDFADFTADLNKVAADPVRTVRDDYTLRHGKRRECSFRANRRAFTLTASGGADLRVVFQVSNDGVAFRYEADSLPGGRATVEAEATGFAMPPDTTAWLEPMEEAKSGWSRTCPAYEMHYKPELPAGTPSPTPAGWCFPALFRVAPERWILLSESDANANYVGGRLSPESPGGLYRIAFPDPRENRGTEDPVAPAITAPFSTPWRALTIGRLNTIVESTLVTDVARPADPRDWSFVKPGRAAWSWLQLDDASCTLPVQRDFAAMAARLGWEYLLVDANWDATIGYGGIRELAREAADMKVGLWLWYNSNGCWNDAPQTPLNRMHEPGARRHEFARLREMGIKGVKVDFFGGDKQQTIQLYLDILADAADHGILVNFHGATIPRGWARTWPNLMTMEGVRGMEHVGFQQETADLQPEHCCILPFTRNAADPMDFTPVVFNPKVRKMTRKTSLAFELALPVIFESGVQHLGVTPADLAAVPDYVADALRSIPASWDETRFLGGFPGRYVVIARRSGSRWFVAGINATAEPVTLKDFDLTPFTPGRTMRGDWITDETGKPGFARSVLDGIRNRFIPVQIPAKGGFLMRLR